MSAEFNSVKDTKDYSTPASLWQRNRSWLRTGVDCCIRLKSIQGSAPPRLNKYATRLSQRIGTKREREEKHWTAYRPVIRNYCLVLFSWATLLRTPPISLFCPNTKNISICFYDAKTPVAQKLVISGCTLYFSQLSFVIGHSFTCLKYTKREFPSRVKLKWRCILKEIAR